MQILTDILSEAVCSSNDFADDLASTHVLFISDVVIDFSPLVSTSTGHLVLLKEHLSFNLLDKLCDELTDSITFFTTEEQLKNTTWLHIRDARHAVLF